MKTILLKKAHPFLWYALLMGISLCCSALLFRALPYGFVFPDTSVYFLLFTDLSHTGISEVDWVRTPVYSFMLGWSTLWSNPSAALFFANALLFAIGIATSAWMMTGLFRSRKSGLLCGCVLLIIEYVSFHTVSYSAFLLSDFLFAILILIGSMLCLGGWLRGKVWPVCIGYCILGIAIFTRPVGLCLIPLWSIIGFVAMRSFPLQTRYPWRVFAVCIVFLIAPALGWSIRNAVVYGSMRETAFGSRNLLPHVINLLQDTDTVMDDPSANQQFIQQVRLFGKTVSTDEDVYRWGSAPTAPNIFDVIGRLNPAPLSQNSAKQIVQHWFFIDPIATRIALRIIAAHPMGYARLVLHNYLSLLHTAFAVGYLEDAHTLMSADKLSSEQRLLFFPPTGFPDVHRFSPKAETMLQSMLLSWPVRHWRLAEKTIFPIVEQIFFCVALLLLWKQPHAVRARLPFVREWAFVLCVLLSTYFLLALFTSMLEAANDRYGIPGKVGAHACLILIVIASSRMLQLRPSHVSFHLFRRASVRRAAVSE